MNQFALPLALPEEGGDNAFIVDASNSESLRHLDHWQHWPVAVTLLTGPRKSGRSSLGRLFAGKTGGTVIDDADLSDEETLFHAWNAAQSSKVPLLIIADDPPPRWKITLPDLRTRIAATPKIRIDEPGDMLIEERLHRHFGAEGLVVPQNVIDYLLKRMERSHYALHQLIETIDRLAFERQSRVSLGLVRDAMNALGFIDV